MANYIVQVPIWEVYHVVAETPEDAWEEAMRRTVPDDSWGMDNVSTEVNLETK